METFQLKLLEYVHTRESYTYTHGHLPANGNLPAKYAHTHICTYTHTHVHGRLPAKAISIYTYAHTHVHGRLPAKATYTYMHNASAACMCLPSACPGLIVNTHTHTHTIKHTHARARAPANRWTGAG